MNILKIIEEEALNYAKSIYRNTEPSELPNNLVIEHIIDYLYNNNEYNIVKGIIKTYDDVDGIKSKSIKLTEKSAGPYDGNKFNTYPLISFNLISNNSGYNIETVEITTYLNGFYKDKNVDKAKDLGLIKKFDNEFYKILKTELKRNLRFDNSTKLKGDFSPIKISNISKDNDVIKLDPSYVNYIESLAKKDSNMYRRNEVLKLVEKVRKQNFYTKRSSYDFFERYKRGDIK